MSQEISSSSPTPPLRQTEDPLCSICLDVIKTADKVSLACNHIFHGECIECWIKIKQSCPLCRSAFCISNAEHSNSDADEVYASLEAEVLAAGDQFVNTQIQNTLRLANQVSDFVGTRPWMNEPRGNVPPYSGERNRYNFSASRNAGQSS